MTCLQLLVHIIVLSCFMHAVNTKIQSYSWNPLDCIRYVCNTSHYLQIHVPYSVNFISSCSEYLDENICSPKSLSRNVSDDSVVVFGNHTTSSFEISSDLELLYLLDISDKEIPSDICLKFFHRNISLKISCFNNNNNHTLIVYNGTKCDPKNIFKIYTPHLIIKYGSKHFISVESYLNPSCNTMISNGLFQDIYARISISSTQLVSNSRLNPVYFFDDLTSFYYCPSHLLTDEQKHLLEIDINKEKIIGIIDSQNEHSYIHTFKSVIIKNGDCIPHWFLSEKCNTYGGIEYDTYCNHYSNRYYFNGNNVNDIIDYKICNKLINKSVIYDGSSMPILTATLWQKLNYYDELPEYKMYFLIGVLLFAVIIGCICTTLIDVYMEGTMLIQLHHLMN
eukprot:432889_1